MFRQRTSDESRHPHLPSLPPVIVTVPGCSPTTATQRTAGASKLPFGLPYGAGLIWNGMVTAADASATDVRVEAITTDVQTISRRTRFITEASSHVQVICLSSLT